MSLKDVIEAQVRTMPFEAVKDLLAEEKVDVDRLEMQASEALARGRPSTRLRPLELVTP